MALNKNTKYFIAGAIILITSLSYWQRKNIKTAFKNMKLTDADKLKFINKIWPSAISIGQSIGVPPLFIISQLALESKYGQSTLTSKYNNFGGIKAVGNQPSVSMLTTECKNGICNKLYQNFAIYPTVLDGLKAQSKIYQNKYFKQHLNKTNDPIQYAKLLQSGKIRYATALNYVDAIQSTLNDIKKLKKV